MTSFYDHFAKEKLIFYLLSVILNSLDGKSSIFP